MGAAGAAAARVGVFVAAEAGADVLELEVGVVVVVDAVEELARAGAGAAQRLQLLLPQRLDPLGRLRRQVRLHRSMAALDVVDMMLPSVHGWCDGEIDRCL